MRTVGAFRRRAAILCTITVLVGCGLAVLADDAERASTSQLSSEASAVYDAVLSELAEGNARFALDLYHALTEAGSTNLFFSPYSISAALAMTYAGARGETERQMRDALWFTLPQQVLHPAFHALDADLIGRIEGIDGVRLSIANALWGQNAYPFLPEFLDRIETSYGAPIRRTEFAGDPEQARVDINEWVRGKTEGLISDLMAPGSITPETRLVLANAIHFLGTWKHPFDEELTQDAPFHRLDGSEVSVPMMVADASYRCTAGEGFLAVELPYAGDRLSMLILLPDEGMFGTFEAAFTAERLDAIVSQMYAQKVWLAMPRFELASEFSLAGVLADLGMPDAFSSGADFSGMDGTRDLFIDDVVHKAYVSVDEKGTEAVGATGVIMTLSLPQMVRVDRPFLFLIRDVETGTILFMGRVTDPSAG